MASILITGAEGQLGNELRIVSDRFHGYDFVFTDIDSLDITVPEKVKDRITKMRPDWIVNCAAYNSVDKAESEPDAAMRVNAMAVSNITEAIKGTGCRFIHISSDYVYEGRSCVPYDESSPVMPLSVYGRSKLEGEKYALLHTGGMVIRTSWLYSPFGKNFVRTILRNAAEKSSLRVVFDQTGTPTYASDLAEAIMHVISGVIRNHFAFAPGIYNYSNEGACTWYDFATEIISGAGLNCHVTPVLSSEYGQDAVRPSYSVMNKLKIRETYGLSIPHWRSSLLNCLKLMT